MLIRNHVREVLRSFKITNGIMYQLARLTVLENRKEVEILTN